MTDPSSSLPPSGARLVLAPGLRVVEDGRDAWQVGSEDPRRVRLPRGAATDLALRTVATASPAPNDASVREVLGSLLTQGILVTLDGLVASGLDPAACAVAAQFPRDFGDRIARRRAASVEVVGTLGAAPEPLLLAAGVPLNPVDSRPTAALVLGSGEIDRELLAGFMREGTPHLLARVVDGVGVLGPFVEPGRTACVRCLDLHRADEQPGADVRLARYAVASARPRPDGLPEPLDLAQATLLTAWAVRDLLTHLDGDRPPTWSSTVRIEPDLTAVTALCWLRHPQCGCAWV